jgi:hypothetical protein
MRQSSHNPKLGQEGPTPSDSAMQATVVSSAGNPAFPDRSEVSLTIVDRVAQFVERFVFLRDRFMYKLVAVWVIATHLHQLFEYTGYLFIHSPEKECGKTRLLEILDLLVLNSTGIDSSPTAAVVARTAWGNTQLLDEGDGWPDLSGLRNVLNAGFQRKSRTYRCQQDNLGSQKPQLLRLYCPRAIAGIGKDILSGTTRDRTFTIEMARQTPEERREELRGRTHEPEAAKLKADIETWAKDHQEKVVVFYDSLLARPLPYLEDFRDRTRDVSEPLGTILELAYADRPAEELSCARRELCSAIAHAREEANQYSEDHRLLIAIEGIMEGEELIEQPSVLAQRLNGTAVNVAHEFAIGEMLRRYGFSQKSVRKDGQPRKCYVIERSRLRDILERYSS